jgi:hypothetical protein
MSEHQETLAQVVKRIDTSFDKIKQYSEKADQYRISAGKQLVELQARIEAGEAGKGVKWWVWYAANLRTAAGETPRGSWRWQGRTTPARPQKKSGPRTVRRSRHTVSAQAKPSRNPGVRLTVSRRNIG